MNEQFIQELYNHVASTGYAKDINSFKELLSTNTEAQDEIYNYISQRGYKHEKDYFLKLIGAGVAGAVIDDTVKKNKELLAQESRPPDDMALSSEAGSLDSPRPEGVSQQQYYRPPAMMESIPAMPEQAPAPAVQQDEQRGIAIGQAPVMDILRGASRGMVRSVEQDIIDKKKNILLNKDPDFLSSMGSIDSDIINKDKEDVTAQMNDMFSKYGFTFSEASTLTGDAVTVRTADGKNQLQVKLNPATREQELAESKNLRDFISRFAQEPQEFKDEDYISKSIRAKTSRRRPMLKEDGTYSAYDFEVYKEGDKYKVVPTIFPEDTNDYTSAQSDWMKLSLDKAKLEAMRRNEVYTFDNEDDAKEFAAGGWQKVNAFDVEGSKFYAERGLDYYSERKKFDNYQNVSEELDFVDRLINLVDEEAARKGELKEGAKAIGLQMLTAGLAGISQTIGEITGMSLRMEDEVDGVLPEEMLKYGQYFNDKGQLVVSKQMLEQKRKELESIKENLFEQVYDAGAFTDGRGVQVTREDFDPILSKRQQEITREAVNDASVAKNEYERLGQISSRVFGVALEDIDKVTPKSEYEEQVLDLLKIKYSEAKAIRNSAVNNFLVAQTYYDAKVNKQAMDDYEENFKGLMTGVSDAWYNGMAANQIMLSTLGIRDVDDPSDTKKVAQKITEALGKVTGKQSRALSRLNTSRGSLFSGDPEALNALLSDPLEIMVTLAATSMTQVLPYASYIVPAATAAGAGAGAAVGSLAAGVGAIPGAVTGGLRGANLGVSASFFALEYTNAILDEMRNRDYNINDPEQVEKALQDDEVWAKGGERGIRRGIPIAVVDFLSGQLAGRIFNPSRMASMTTKISTQIAERALLDPGAEAFGELAAQISAGEGISAKEIQAEILGGFGSKISHAGINILTDSFKQNNIDFAHDIATNLPKMVSQRYVSPERISNWANRMEKTGQIDAETNQRIQQNVSLMTEARQVLDIEGTAPLGKSNRAVLSRIMELLQAQRMIESNDRLKQLYSEKRKAINEELLYISENKKLKPKKEQADIEALTPKKPARYRINGRSMTREKFIEEIDSMNDKRLARAKVTILNDQELTTVYAKKINDAIQKQKTGKVPVQPEAGVSQEVEEGEPEAGLEAPADQGVQEEEEAVTDETTRLDELQQLIPEPIEYSEEQGVNDQNREGVLSSIAAKLAEETQLSDDENALYQENKDRVDQLVGLIAERTALNAEVEELNKLFGIEPRQQSRGETTQQESRDETQQQEAAPQAVEEAQQPTPQEVQPTTEVTTEDAATIRKERRKVLNKLREKRRRAVKANKNTDAIDKEIQDAEKLYEDRLSQLTGRPAAEAAVEEVQVQPDGETFLEEKKSKSGKTTRFFANSETKDGKRVTTFTAKKEDGSEKKVSVSPATAIDNNFSIVEGQIPSDSFVLSVFEIEQDGDQYTATVTLSNKNTQKVRKKKIKLKRKGTGPVFRTSLEAQPQVEEEEVALDDVEKIVDYMNKMQSESFSFVFNIKMTYDGAGNVKINMDEVNKNYPGNMPVVDLSIINGLKAVYTISDQLASGARTNPVTGKPVTNLFGGFGFGVFNPNSAWAYTAEDKATDALKKAKELYEADKEAYEAWWKKHPQYDGLIPMVVVKMGETSIHSNEATFRVLRDNMSRHSVENRKKALDILVDGMNKIVKEINEKAKFKVDKSGNKILDENGLPVRDYSKKENDTIKSFNIFLELAKNANTIDELISNENLMSMPIGLRVPMFDILTYGSTRTAGSTKGVAVGKGPKKNTITYSILKALVGDDENSFPNFHKDIITYVVSEEEIVKIPPRNIISITGIDVRANNIQIERSRLTEEQIKEAENNQGTFDHPNYPYGLKGKLIGALSTTVPLQDVSPAAYVSVMRMAQQMAGKVKEVALEKRKSTALEEASSLGVATGTGLSTFIGTPINTEAASAVQVLLRYLNDTFPFVKVYLDSNEFMRAIAKEDTTLVTKNGLVLYGVTINGDIYINPDVHKKETIRRNDGSVVEVESELFNTAIHEFGHIWTKYMQLDKRGTEIYNKGIQLIEQAIQDDKYTARIFEEQMRKFEGNKDQRARALDETMVILIGNKGEAIAKASIKAQFKEWLFGMWDYLRRKFKLSKDITAEDLQEMTLDDFLGMALLDLTSGQKALGLKITEAREKKIRAAFEYATLSARQNIEDTVHDLRQQGYNDDAIEAVLMQMGYKKPVIRKAMAITFRVDEPIPTEFLNVFDGNFLNGAIDKGAQIFYEVRAKLYEWAISDDAKKAKTYEEIRQKAMELIKAHPVYSQQTTTTRMQLIYAFDKMLNTRRGRNVQQQIDDIRKILRQRTIGQNELARIQSVLRTFIRTSLPKSDTYSQVQINRLLTIVNNVKRSNFSEMASKIMEIVVKQRKKMKQRAIVDMLKFAENKAKIKISSKNLNRVRGLDAEGVMFFRAVAPLLRAIINNDTAKLDAAYNSIQEAEQSGLLAEIFLKANRNEKLTLKEEEILALSFAYDIVIDLPNMEVEHVNTLFEELRATSMMSSLRLNNARQLRMMEYARMNAEASAQIEELYPFLFVTDEQPAMMETDDTQGASHLTNSDLKTGERIIDARTEPNGVSVATLSQTKTEGDTTTVTFRKNNSTQPGNERTSTSVKPEVAFKDRFTVMDGEVEQGLEISSVSKIVTTRKVDSNNVVTTEHKAVVKIKEPQSGLTTQKTVALIDNKAVASIEDSHLSADQLTPGETIVNVETDSANVTTVTLSTTVSIGNEDRTSYFENTSQQNEGDRSSVDVSPKLAFGGRFRPRAGQVPNNGRIVSVYQMVKRMVPGMTGNTVAEYEAVVNIRDNDTGEVTQQTIALDEIRPAPIIKKRLKTENELIQDKASIMYALKKLRLAEALMKLIEQWDLRTFNGMGEFIKQKLFHLGTLVNILDNVALGKTFLYDNIYRPLNRMDERSKKGFYEQRQKLDDIANSIDGITKGYRQIELMLNKGLHEIKVKGKTIVLSKDAMLRIYALSLNEVQRYKLAKMGFDEAKIDEIKNIIGPQAVEFAEKIVSYLSNDYFESINATYRSVNYVNLGYVNNYFPTMTESSTVNIEDIIAGNFSSVFLAETSTSLRNRTDLRGEVKINYAFTDTLEGYIKSMEKYKAYALGVNRLNALFKNKAFDTLMGETGLRNLIRRSVNYAITPNAGAQDRATIASSITNNFTRWQLGFKPIQFVKQASSFIAAWTDYSYFPEGANIPTVMREPVNFLMFMVDEARILATLPQSIKKAMEISGDFRARLERGLKGETFNLESGVFRPVQKRAGMLAAVQRAFNQASGFFTAAGDIAGVMGYMALYNRDIANGMSEEMALERFNKYNETQQSSRGADKNALQQSQNELVRMFTLFGSATFLMINNVAQSLNNMAKSISAGKMVRAYDVKNFITNLGVMNVMFVAAANSAKLINGDEEDRQEVLISMIEAMAGLNLIFGIPLIGEAFETAYAHLMGRRSTSNVINPLTRMLKSVYKGVDEGDAWKAGKPVVELVTGVNADPAVGLYKMLAAEDYDDEAIYMLLGISPSYRPKPDAPVKEPNKKPMSKKDMKEFSPMIYEQIYGPGSPNYEYDKLLKETQNMYKDLLKEQAKMYSGK